MYVILSYPQLNSTHEAGWRLRIGMHDASPRSSQPIVCDHRASRVYHNPMSRTQHLEWPLSRKSRYVWYYMMRKVPILRSHIRSEVDFCATSRARDAIPSSEFRLQSDYRNGGFTYHDPWHGMRMGHGSMAVIFEQVLTGVLLISSRERKDLRIITLHSRDHPTFSYSRCHTRFVGVVTNKTKSGALSKAASLQWL
jgi:hypothetical protein